MGTPPTCCSIWKTFVSIQGKCGTQRSPLELGSRCNSGTAPRFDFPFSFVPPLQRGSRCNGGSARRFYLQFPIPPYNGDHDATVEMHDVLTPPFQRSPHTMGITMQQWKCTTNIVMFGYWQYGKHSKLVKPPCLCNTRASLNPTGWRGGVPPRQTPHPPTPPPPAITPRPPTPPPPPHPQLARLTKSTSRGHPLRLCPDPPPPNAQIPEFPPPAAQITKFPPPAAQIPKSPPPAAQIPRIFAACGANAKIFAACGANTEIPAACGANTQNFRRLRRKCQNPRRLRRKYPKRPTAPTPPPPPKNLEREAEPLQAGV